MTPGPVHVARTAAVIAAFFTASLYDRSLGPVQCRLLSTDRPWPSTAVDSLVFRFTRMCSTSRSLVPSTSLDDLFVTSTGVIQIFCNKCSRLVNTDPFMGLHREPRVCQVETSELGLILFFFPFTLRMIRSGIGLSHWPLYNQVLQ